MKNLIQFVATDTDKTLEAITAAIVGEKNFRLDPHMRALFEAELQQAARDPSLAPLLGHAARDLPLRFCQYHQSLARLSRQVRRSLQRGWKRTLAGIALLMALGQAPALAASINVDGACTLADAITAANSDAAAGGCPAGSGADALYLGGDVALSAALPAITSAVTIEGGGHTISGNNTFRILQIAYPGNLSLLQTTVSGGGGVTDGGGIANNGGIVSVIDSTVSGNSASQAGGGIANNSGGTVTVTRSIISGNTAGGAGGIMQGGGIFNGDRGSVTVTDSTVSGNFASHYGGGIGNTTIGTVTVTRSTVSGNSANLSGGGISAFASYVTLVDSTVSGNGAESGGGITSAQYSTVTLTSSTVSGNSADIGGGMANVGFESEIMLDHSLVSGNIASEECAEIYGGSAIGYNLIGHDGDAFSCSFLQSSSVIVPSESVSAILGPLADNGGPTLTHALPAGSPAIDAATDGSCLSDTDQRGISRPQGPYCDIGAFEAAVADTPDTLVEFFNEAVQAGDLTGAGTGQSASNRLDALGNMLALAADLVAQGSIAEACDQYLDALRKTDGDPVPPDFVQGEAADDLAQLIINIREDLGCE
ncbi:MAG: choice-of-anchor Q domain-containing protein [Gammaproteobacteria bacterium]